MTGPNRPGAPGTEYGPPGPPPVKPCGRARKNSGRKAKPRVAHGPHLWHAGRYLPVGDLGYTASCPGWSPHDAPDAPPSATGAEQADRDEFTARYPFTAWAFTGGHGTPPQPLPDTPCGGFTGNVCSGFGGSTRCFSCGWDRTDHPA